MGVHGGGHGIATARACTPVQTYDERALWREHSAITGMHAHASVQGLPLVRLFVAFPDAMLKSPPALQYCSAAAMQSRGVWEWEDATPQQVVSAPVAASCNVQCAALPSAAAVHKAVRRLHDASIASHRPAAASSAVPKGTARAAHFISSCNVQRYISRTVRSTAASTCSGALRGLGVLTGARPVTNEPTWAAHVQYDALSVKHVRGNCVTVATRSVATRRTQVLKQPTAFLVLLHADFLRVSHNDVPRDALAGVPQVSLGTHGGVKGPGTAATRCPRPAPPDGCASEDWLLAQCPELARAFVRYTHRTLAPPHGLPRRDVRREMLWHGPSPLLLARAAAYMGVQCTHATWTLVYSMAVHACNALSRSVAAQRQDALLLLACSHPVRARGRKRLRSAQENVIMDS